MAELTDTDYRQYVHDLRERVLNGGDIEAEEMFAIIDQIRAGRRAAGSPVGRGAAAKRSKKAPAAAAAAPLDLGKILDQDL
jgi:hypothetical protein